MAEQNTKQSEMTLKLPYTTEQNVYGDLKLYLYESKTTENLYG